MKSELEHQRQYEYYCDQPSKRPMSSSIPIQVPPRQIRQNLNQLFGLCDDQTQQYNSNTNNTKYSYNKNNTGDIYQARFQRRLSAQLGSGINCQGIANNKKGQHSSTLSSSAGSSASASSSSTSTANNNHQQQQQPHQFPHHCHASCMLDLDGNNVVSISYTDDDYLEHDHEREDHDHIFDDEELHQEDYYYYLDSQDSNGSDQPERRSSLDYVRQQQYHTNSANHQENNKSNVETHFVVDNDDVDDDDDYNEHLNEHDDEDYDEFFNQEYNESHQNRYLRDKDSDGEPPRAGDDPMKLFESIQALARSLHKNTNLVGSLPPKRLIASPVRSLALA